MFTKIKNVDWPLIASILVFAAGIFFFYKGFDMRQNAIETLKPVNTALFRAWSATGLAYMTVGALMTLAAIFAYNIEINRREQQKTIERLNWSMERIAAIESERTTAPRNQDTKWPWGPHHTDALGHLEAAANRFWGSLYDPSDPTTAPTNEMVAEWLRNERNVSKEKAYAIASILRADGLKTGPRR